MDGVVDEAMVRNKLTDSTDKPARLSSVSLVKEPRMRHDEKERTIPRKRSIYWRGDVNVMLIVLKNELDERIAQLRRSLEPVNYVHGSLICIERQGSS